MPTDLITPDRSAAITKDGNMLERFWRWVVALNSKVNNLEALSGTGTPEGNEVASVGRFYVDTSASILYYKATGDGDTGWIAL